MRTVNERSSLDSVAYAHTLRNIPSVSEPVNDNCSGHWDFIVTSKTKSYHPEGPLDKSNMNPIPLHKAEMQSNNLLVNRREMFTARKDECRFTVTESHDGDHDVFRQAKQNFESEHTNLLEEDLYEPFRISSSSRGTTPLLTFSSKSNSTLVSPTTTHLAVQSRKYIFKSCSDSEARFKTDSDGEPSSLFELMDQESQSSEVINADDRAETEGTMLSIQDANGSKSNHKKAKRNNKNKNRNRKKRQKQAKSANVCVDDENTEGFSTINLTFNFDDSTSDAGSLRSTGKLNNMQDVDCEDKAEGAIKYEESTAAFPSNNAGERYIWREAQNTTASNQADTQNSYNYTPQFTFGKSLKDPSQGIANITENRVFCKGTPWWRHVILYCAMLERWAQYQQEQTDRANMIRRILGDNPRSLLNTDRTCDTSTSNGEGHSPLIKTVDQDRRTTLHQDSYDPVLLNENQTHRIWSQTLDLPERPDSNSLSRPDYGTNGIALIFTRRGNDQEKLGADRSWCTTDDKAAAEAPPNDGGTLSALIKTTIARSVDLVSGNKSRRKKRQKIKESKRNPLFGPGNESARSPSENETYAIHLSDRDEPPEDEKRTGAGWDVSNRSKEMAVDTLAKTGHSRDNQEQEDHAQYMSDASSVTLANDPEDEKNPVIGFVNQLRKDKQSSTAFWIKFGSRFCSRCNRETNTAPALDVRNVGAVDADEVPGRDDFKSDPADEPRVTVSLKCWMQNLSAEDFERFSTNSDIRRALSVMARPSITLGPARRIAFYGETKNDSLFKVKDQDAITETLYSVTDIQH